MQPLYGIVAGELSGDALGAGLIDAIRARQPDARFVGIAGPAMLERGCESLADMERLSVMGLVEPLRRLPELIAIRRRLYRYFAEHRPAVVIGIDSPDFNLGLLRKLRREQIPTCQYVCPSVWAWRQGRVRTIARSVDRVLCLLPFEAQFLQEHAIAASFVGHPLARRFAHPQPPMPANPAQARSMLAADHPLIGDASVSTLLCVMPGSRRSEVERLAGPFIESCRGLLQQNPALAVVIPAASRDLYRQLDALLGQHCAAAERERIVLHEGQSAVCMQAADLVLLASGTATLEAGLLGKPMVVAYCLAPLTWWLAQRLVKVDHVALPNLLLEQRLVPELLQHEVTPARLIDECQRLIDDVAERERIAGQLHALGRQLDRDSDELAAAAVLALAQ